MNLQVRNYKNYPMKLNNDAKFSKKQIFLLFASFFVVHLLISGLTYWVIEKDMTWVSKLISSLIFAVIITFLFSLSNKHFNKNLPKDVSSALADDGRVQIEVPAGQKSGIIVYGGRLILTDKRLLFFKPNFFQKTRMWTLQKENINHIKPKKIFLIANNGIEITDRYGKTYSFNMQKRDEILIALKKQLGLSLE